MKNILAILLALTTLLIGSNAYALYCGKNTDSCVSNGCGTFMGKQSKCEKHFKANDMCENNVVGDECWPCK